MTRTLRLAVALSAALLGAACGGGVPDPAPPRPAATLSPGQVSAIATILRLEDTRTFRADTLAALAGDESEEVARRAVMAAGRLGGAEAAALLVDVLARDARPRVRADAAFALGEAGDTSAAVIEALRRAAPRAWIPLRDDDTQVVEEILGALGKLGTVPARRLVQDALRSVHPANEPRLARVARAGLLAVWRFAGDRTRVLAAAPYLDHPDDEIRWRAAYALTRSREPAGVPRLLPLIGDDDHRVREYAARGLDAALADSAGVADSARATLVRATSDAHPHVRINAIRALAGYDAAPEEPFLRLARDRDENVAIAAVNALGARTPPAAEALSALLADPRRPLSVRGAALAQLAVAEPGAAGDAVEEWSRGPFAQRYAAARSLTALGAGRAASTIDRLARDEDVRIVVAALTAAGVLLADTTLDPAARAPLRALLQDLARAPDPWVRTVARRGLGDSTAVPEPAGLPQPPPVASRDPAFYEDVVRRYVAGPLAGEDRPRATITTPRGRIELVLLGDEAPLTVHNFVTLAEAGFWDRGVWHRVVPNFVLQDGAPAGDPSGGPGWAIRDEINRVRYGRGMLGMALSGPDTGGSQWFITHSPQPHLDGGYTVFGFVADGMDVADAVVQGDEIVSIRVAP